MKIAFISCVKTKRVGTHLAKDLYISPLFKMALAYTSQRYDKVCILSAKYGLLQLDDKISHYEDTLNGKSSHDRKVWSYKVYRQIEQLFGLSHEFYFYCGKNYHEFLSAKIPHSHTPLSGLSIGYQLQFYKENS